MAPKRRPHGSDAIRVFLVDDHPVVRRGVALVVNSEPGLTVVGEAEGGADALANMEASQPDVAVVDLTLKDISGLQLIKDITMRFPEVRVLVLSMQEDASYVERALKAGASGYLTKDEAPTAVTAAIRRAHKGELVLSDKLSGRVIRVLVRQGHATASDAVESLSDRQLEIFECIGRGMSTRAISKRLHVSIKTVESHRETIKEKLALANSTELLKRAIEWLGAHEHP